MIPTLPPTNLSCSLSDPLVEEVLPTLHDPKETVFEGRRVSQPLLYTQNAPSLLCPSKWSRSEPRDPREEEKGDFLFNLKGSR